jgi:rhamnosyltransferase
VGAAFGRQLPRPEAGPIEAHARRFNYPPESRIKTADDIPRLGLKTAFISNSFAAYRRSALEAVGGFPSRCIVSEDTYVAARMLIAGWKIAYCAEAQVYHSHGYTYRQDFQRYFDIGVFHAREPWVRNSFGGAEGEGWRYLHSELSYLAGTRPWQIPSALVRTIIKYSGFRAGLFEKSFPLWLKRRMSMQKAFWDRETGGDYNA